jgi:hypothetical protein
MTDRTMAEAFEQAAVVIGDPRHLVTAVMQELGVNWLDADEVLDGQIKESGFSTLPMSLGSLAHLLRECAKAVAPTDPEGTDRG